MFDSAGRVGKQWAHLVLSVDRSVLRNSACLFWLQLGPFATLLLNYHTTENGNAAFNFPLLWFGSELSVGVYHLTQAVTAYADGAIVDTFGFPLDWMGPLNLAYNGADTTDTITWDTAERGWLGGFDFVDYDITLGACDNHRTFSGDIAAVSLHDVSVNGNDADCLFQ
jgi:hypothetical protein